MQKIAHLENLVAMQTSPVPSVHSVPSAPTTPAETSRMEALLERTLNRIENLEGKMSEQARTVIPADQPKEVSPQTAKPSEKPKGIPEPSPEDEVSESEGSDDDDDEWVTTPSGQRVTLIDIYI